jgi:cytochrome c
MVCGIVASNLNSPEELQKPANKIEGVSETPAGGAQKPAGPAPIAPLLAKADPKKGEALADKICAACHTFTKGGPNRIGPNLWNVVGRKQASEPGFDYSSALKKHTGTWTYDQLNDWLDKPSAYAPGTRMSFAGFQSDSQRADVIAYLRTLSDNPEPLPKPEAAPAPEQKAGQAPAGQQAGQKPAEQKPAAAQPQGQAPAAQPATQAKPAPETPAAQKGEAGTQPSAPQAQPSGQGAAPSNGSAQQPKPAQ